MEPGKTTLRSQKNATWAYERVREWKSKAKEKKDEKELKSHIRRLPSVIQACGLAQSLLFYGKKHDAIAVALVQQLLLGKEVSEGVRNLVAMEASGYRAKTREAMELAQWLKRFAEVMLED